MQYFSYLITRAFVEVFRLIPFSVVYLISNFVAFVLHKVVKYRRAVIFDNLKRCFPEKSASEHEAIAKASYQNLADIMLESIKGTSVSLDEIKRRFRYLNYELPNQLLDAGRSLVIVGGHYNNWEWGVISIGGGFHGKTVGIYKPLSNPYTNKWFFRTRSRDGYMILKSMKETYGSVEEYRGTPSIFMLVADQSPSNRKTAINAQFFGQLTACLPGGEVIARNNDYAVLMYDIQRVKRGHYELTFKEVNLEPAQTAPGMVTQQIMAKIEEQIRENPGPWLWSHRRWKWKVEESV